MKAMIFAAGLGTRLKPLTDTMPKALVKVGGRPLLDIVARRLINSGVDSLVINAHHFASQIIRHVEDAGGYGVEVNIPVEEDVLLETGGGILNARKYLEGCGCFLVHNVDILTDLDLREFAGKMRPDALATLAVSPRKTSRYLLFDDRMRLKGWTDIRTGEVRSPWPGLDPSTCTALAFSGIHCISDKIFKVMDEFGFSGRFPIMDLYLKAAAQYPIYGAVQTDMRLMDVGKTEVLGEADCFFEELKRNGTFGE